MSQITIAIGLRKKQLFPGVVDEIHVQHWKLFIWLVNILQTIPCCGVVRINLEYAGVVCLCLAPFSHTAKCPSSENYTNRKFKYGYILDAIFMQCNTVPGTYKFFAPETHYIGQIWLVIKNERKILDGLSPILQTAKRTCSLQQLQIQSIDIDIQTQI